MTNHPRRIGKFELIERLGEGAMGEVFLARDTLIGREVALKTIRPAALTSPDARERFFREAQAAGRLNHPNLVTIHEFGEDAGVHYIAMEHVPGDDLAALLASRELSRPAILDLLAQVCDGLAYAHQRGVVHRDIKPSNVRVTRFSNRLTAKILDFGIARLPGSDLTSTGTLLGTFGYLAPEAIQGGKADHRADLFAVGVLLYEALAGERPFDGESTATVLHRIVHDEPAPLDPEALEGVSPALRDVVARALAKAPAARYATADALAADLRAARNPAWTGGDTREITVRMPRIRPEGGTAPRRGLRILVWSLLAVLLAGAAGGGAWAWRRHRRRARAAAQAVQPVPQAVAVPVPAAPDPTPTQPPAAQPAPETAPPVQTPAPGQNPGQPPAAHPVPSQPAAQPPAPAPAPAPYRDLDAAAAALDKDPRGALAALEGILQREPDNERAIALRIAALYESGDYRGTGRAMMEAKRGGHPLWPMALKYPRLRQVFERERLQPRLPRRRAEGADQGR
ncbi:serine/threonine-protein kinase [Mesoterricola sediminis]|uniref:Protein kinase domain-containing protein n=1 Tax=Mesoterricola sediminis TaxID=2927980 RepID=A0AA48GVD0_9BACT|nr:serine/threonine-protein kinase [Mesoterricola sediminis]BDU78312.1 hypothetical protein METESE_32700 [Mesoterricola sediminis]